MNIIQITSLANKMVMRNIKLRLRHFGCNHNLSTVQVMILVNINEGVNGVNIISKELLLTRQAVHQVVHKMIEIGYLRLVRSDRDKRFKAIEFTDKGCYYAYITELIIDDTEDFMSLMLGDEKMCLLKDVLNTIIVPK
ncbi:MAG: MarR family transcriptional regulator [Flavobacteriales bacterium]|nr:MarR family transcriptional regulator [Flavobacteriales bacterium]